jgi:chromosome segregation ATPase
MATVSNAPGIPISRVLSPSYNDEGENLSTLPDPRSRTMSPANDPSCATTPSQQPDLSSEITTLSNKLINAINQQTSLDDTLTATRHELEASRERVRQLERENAEHKSLVSNGILIQSSVAEAEKNKLLATLAEERRKRGEVEKAKRSIEQELENLTTALFEEANKVCILPLRVETG